MSLRRFTWLSGAGAALAALAPLAFGQVERPVILVVQVNPPKIEEGYGKGALVYDLLPSLRKAFDSDARLKAVLWSREDRDFREATATLILPDEPNDDVISEAAKRLKSRYILVVEGVRTPEAFYSKAELFQTGRRGALWTSAGRNKKERASQVIKRGAEPDWEATAESAIGTWILQLGQGPLRQVGLGQPTAPNPFDPSLEARLPRLELAATAGQEALAMAESLLKEGRRGRAILYLKDAVDANPFEPNRRIRLMELMVDEGLALEAAGEGRRAARLTADQPELWLASAKTWLLADKPEEAEQDLKEALARGVSTALAHRLLGDVALIQGEVARARDEYSISLEKEDSPRTRLGLAVSFSLVGQPVLAEAILKKEPAVTGPLLESDYGFLTDLLDTLVRKVGRQLADSMPEIRVSPGSEPLVQRISRLAAQSEALSRVISLISPPRLHEPSHSARVLAHKLMVQASQEVLSFAKGGDPEAGLEVVMSLGEGLRQLATSREMLRDERQQRSERASP